MECGTLIEYAYKRGEEIDSVHVVVEMLCPVGRRMFVWTARPELRDARYLFEAVGDKLERIEDPDAAHYAISWFEAVEHGLTCPDDCLAYKA